MGREIPLTKGFVTLVDDEDFVFLMQWKWHARNSDCIYAIRSQYVQIAPGKRKQIPIHMHRVLTDCPQGMFVDHINGDGLDNRRKNLRVCTTAQNIKNMKKSDRPLTSPYKGVSWHKHRGCWQATIKANYKAYHLGLFDNIEAAAVAYNAAASKLHGEFARLNQVEAA